MNDCLVVYLIVGYHNRNVLWFSAFSSSHALGLHPIDFKSSQCIFNDISVVFCLQVSSDGFVHCIFLCQMGESVSNLKTTRKS